jgi:hypothetical protein
MLWKQTVMVEIQSNDEPLTRDCWARLFPWPLWHQGLRDCHGCCNFGMEMPHIYPKGVLFGELGGLRSRDTECKASRMWSSLDERQHL